MSDAYGPSGGQMLRRAFFWTVGCGFAAYAVPKCFDQLGFSSILTPAEPQQLPPKQHPSAMRNTAPDEASDVAGPVTERFRAVSGNQFVITASVNGNLIRFMVDSGATYVSLLPEDAQKLGFNLNTLDWNVETRTANGKALNAEVKLTELRIGSITKFDVPALVMRASGGISLLGMTYLSRLKSWQISNGVLTLAG
jgi:aspartyl protease family protein